MPTALTVYLWDASGVPQRAGTGAALPGGGGGSGSDVPGAPQTVAATAGDTTATLTWDAPAVNASAVTGYRVGRDNGAGGEGWETIDGANVRSRTFYALTNGLEYDLWVEAVNGDAITGTRVTVQATPAQVSEPDPGNDSWGTTRNKYLHPFPVDSIWNRPIGANAVRQPANLGYQSAWNPYGWSVGMVTHDPDHLGLGPTDPIKTLTVTSAGSSHNGAQVRVPADLYHDGGLNGCAALLVASNPDLILQGQPITVSPGGNPKWTWTIPSGTETNLKTNADASRLGSHGGSRLSTLGGTLRPGELTDQEPIHHALKLNVHASRYLYGGGPAGHTWPADRADNSWNQSGHPERYGWRGATPPTYMLMGALLALPSAFSDLGYHPKVKKLIAALKNYGAYVVDNTAWAVYGLNMQDKVWDSNEFPHQNTTDARTFHEDLHYVITQLECITNVSAGATAGGGAAIASDLYAPATFSN